MFAQTFSTRVTAVVETGTITYEQDKTRKIHLTHLTIYIELCYLKFLKISLGINGTIFPLPAFYSHLLFNLHY